MLQPLCRFWSSDTWITVADGTLPMALKVPPRSTQSRLRMTSASFTAAIRSSVAKVAG